jgi:transcriptional regulator GlxA family with amidase domain
MLKPAVLEDLRRLSGSARYVTSVCTGSLILAASGLLKGKRSACHWACLNILKEYGAIPDPARVVQDGSFISGGGVTSGIDFALTVAAEIAGPLAAQTAQLFIEYNPAPPFRAGHPSVAPREVIAAAEKQLPGGSKGLFRLTT